MLVFYSNNNVQYKYLDIFMRLKKQNLLKL